MAHQMRTFTVDSDDPADEPEFTGWLDALQLGFLNPVVRPWLAAFQLRAWRREDPRFRAVYDDSSSALRNPHEPVGTMISFAKTITTGVGRSLPIGAITDVTVRTTHRRRGILRQMMTAELADLAAAGVPAAALTVSEGGIYRRFGFGQAVVVQRVRVRTDRDFGLRPAIAGQVEIVSRATYFDRVYALFADYHRVTPGSVDRYTEIFEALGGEVQHEHEGPDHNRRHALYVDPEGAVAGAVTWEIKESDQLVKVHDLIAPTAAADLAIWDFLAHIDLTTSVERGFRRVDDPLPYALTEPDVYSVTGVRALVWLRILDVPAALAARDYLADGQIVLAVADDLGHASGTYAVSVTGGTATVEPTEAPAEVTLDVAALGSALLGGVSVRTLADAGLVSGPGIDRFARLMATDAAPTCITPF